MHRPMWEKGGIIYALHRSIQRTHHVYVQRLLQDCHTLCGQTVILTNGELAAALLSLSEKNREIIFLYFFADYTQQEIGEMYGRCRSTTGYQIRRTLKLLQRKMEVLSHGESESFAL